MLEVTGGAWKSGPDATGPKATVFEPWMTELGGDQLLKEVAESFLMKALADNEAAIAQSNLAQDIAVQALSGTQPFSKVPGNSRLERNITSERERKRLGDRLPALEVIRYSVLTVL